jgi:hypothetical protein
MILTKQLELQGTESVVSTSTPRGNLARELEKYSRPDLAALTNKLAEQQIPSMVTPNQVSVPKPVPKKDTTERPNILRRPSFKPKLSRSGSSSSESSISSSSAVPATSTGSTTISNILSQQRQGNTNTEYTRSVTTVTIPNPIVAGKVLPQMHGTVVSQSEQSPSTAKTVYVTSNGQTLMLPPGYILLPQ